MSEMRTSSGVSNLSDQQRSIDEPDLQPLNGSMQMVGLQKVVTNVFERVHGELSQLLTQASSLGSEAERKRALMLQLHSARQQLIRLAVLVKWSKKAPAVAELNKVLEKASQHSRALQSAADEAYSSHVERATRFAPLFDVLTSLEVLETGTFKGLPSEIETLIPTPPLSEEEKEVKLAHITHLIHSELLKVRLPGTIEISSIDQGILVLTSPRLYEAKFTLTPVLKVPDAPSIKAKALGINKQSTEEPDVSSSASALASSSDQDQRWQWLLLDIKFLVASSIRPPLHWSQINYLIQDLNYRMNLASDSAVYLKMEEEIELSMRQQEPQEGMDVEMKCEGGPSSQPAPSSAPSGPLSKSYLPTSSGYPTANHAGGISGYHKGSHLELKLKELKDVSSDEKSAPLMTAHLVIGDLAMRLFVDSAVTISRQLVEVGGRWEGHGRVVGQGRWFIPGVRVSYWTQAVSLLEPKVEAVEEAGAGSGSGAAGAGSGSGAGGDVKVGIKRKERGGEGELDLAGQCGYIIELGVDVAKGTIAVHHSPPLPSLPSLSSLSSHSSDDLDECWMDQALTSEGRRGEAATCPLPSTCPLLDTHLDSGTVNIDELMLRAAIRQSARDLLTLREELERGLGHLSSSYLIKLSSKKLHWVRQSCQSALAERRAFVASMSASIPPSDLELAASVTLSCPLLKICYNDEGLPQRQGNDRVMISISRNLITGRLTLHPPLKDEANDISSDPSLLKSLRQAEEVIHQAMLETRKTTLVSVSPLAAAREELVKVIGDRVRYMSTTMAYRALSEGHGMEIKSLGASGLTRSFLKDGVIQKMIGEERVEVLLRSSYWFLGSRQILPTTYTLPPSSDALLPPLKRAKALSFLLSADHPHCPRSFSLLVNVCNDLGVTTRLLRIHAIPSTAQGTEADLVNWCKRRMNWELLMVQLGVLGIKFVERIGESMGLNIESLPPFIVRGKQHLPIPCVGSDSISSGVAMRTGIMSIECLMHAGVRGDSSLAVKIIGRLPSSPVLPSFIYSISKETNAALDLASDLTKMFNAGS